MAFEDKKDEYNRLSESVKWLVSCPVSDGNYKNRVKAASREDILKAMDFIVEIGKTETTKYKDLQKHLKKFGDVPVKTVSAVKMVESDDDGFEGWDEYDPQKGV